MPPQAAAKPAARSSVTNGSFSLATTRTGNGRRSRGIGAKRASSGTAPGASTSHGATISAPATRVRPPRNAHCAIVTQPRL